MAENRVTWVVQEDIKGLWYDMCVFGNEKQARAELAAVSAHPQFPSLRLTPKRLVKRTVSVVVAEPYSTEHERLASACEAYIEAIDPSYAGDMPQWFARKAQESGVKS